MAKHPVPKRRATSTRSGRRHSTFQTLTLKKLNAVSATVVCKSCGAARRPHTACLSCGVYRERQILNVASKAKKIEKVKA